MDQATRTRLTELRRTCRSCTIANCDTKFLLSLLDRERVELSDDDPLNTVGVMISMSRGMIEDLTILEKRTAIRSLVERAERQLLDFFEVRP